MRYTIALSLAVIGLVIACVAKAPPPVVFQIPTRHVDYMKEVKPLLDKRCAVCHSCYNSPCQLKLDSFEGADRGMEQNGAERSFLTCSCHLQVMNISGGTRARSGAISGRRLLSPNINS